MKETYLAECLEKFHELPSQLQEMIGGLEACAKIKKIEEEYGVSVSFATILVAIGELTIDDLTDYLNIKFKLDKIKGAELTEKLKEEIFDDVYDFIIDNSDDEDEEDLEMKNNFGLITAMSATDKKELILKTFRGEIIPALKAEPAIVEDFNIAIFQSFNAFEDLEDEVERLLYINQEKLSEHQIVIDGHPAKA